MTWTELDKLEQAGTPRPWTLGLLLRLLMLSMSDQYINDAALVVAARNELPRLLKELREARAIIINSRPHRSYLPMTDAWLERNME